MKRNLKTMGWALLGLVIFAGVNAELFADKLRVVTTTTDLAYIAEQVGGERVMAESLTRGYDDPHYISPRPDFVVKMNRADVFVQVGLDLEVGWAPTLLRQARNPKIQRNAPGFCDAAKGVRVLDVPRGNLDRSAGDFHAYGNPHYWTDPLNAAIIARNIRDSLIAVDPESTPLYEKNYNNFRNRLKELTLRELGKFKAYKGLKVAVYHREFTYLAARFKFKVAVSIEEKPGVPPSAIYLRKVIQKIRRDQIKVILVAPFNNQVYARRVAKATGAKIVIMPLSVGSLKGIDTYERTIQSMLGRIRAGLRK